MTTVRKGRIAKEDFAFHDPTTGTTEETFNRTSYTGSTVSRTKFSAQAVTTLDAAVVIDAGRPFGILDSTGSLAYGLSNANHTIEKELEYLRLNTPHYINLAALGLVEGSGATQAQAQKNVAVWNEATGRISSVGRGGGIFVPAGTWVFDGSLTGSTKSNFAVLGSGRGTTIKAFAASANPFLYFTDCSGVTMAELAIDNTSGTNAAVMFYGSPGKPVSNTRLHNLNISNTRHAIQIASNGGHGSGFWITGCNMATTNYDIIVLDTSGGYVANNITSGSNLYSLYCGLGSTGDVLGEMIVRDNYFSRGINFYNSITPVSTHKGIRIQSNKIGSGDIKVSDLNEVDISNNELFSGGIIYDVTKADARTFRCNSNMSNGGQYGVYLHISGAYALTGFEILGGRYYGAQMHGIFISSGTIPSTRGRVVGAEVLNCNTTNNNGDGINISPTGGAGGGLTKSYFGGCVIASEAAPKHRYGFYSGSSSASNQNAVVDVLVSGWQTAAKSASPPAGFTLVDSIRDLGT